jgi:hypothetical protein
MLIAQTLVDYHYLCPRHVRVCPLDRKRRREGEKDTKVRTGTAMEYIAKVKILSTGPLNLELF